MPPRRARFGEGAGHAPDGSDASASSGVHDSAGSLSPVRARKRRAAGAGEPRRGGAHSLSGSDPFSSHTSGSSGRHSAHGAAEERAADIAECLAAPVERVPTMARVPEHDQVPCLLCAATLQLLRGKLEGLPLKTALLVPCSI